MVNAINTIVELKCDKCSNMYNITLDRKNRRERAGTPNYCQKCMKEYMREKQTNYFSSLSPEEQQKFKDKRNWYATASDEKKAEFSQKMSDINNSRSDEDKAIINQKNAEGVKKHWDKLSQQQRLDRVKGMREGNKLYWDSMTPEERSKRASEWYYSLPEDERQAVHDALSERMTSYNASLTYEEKVERAKCMQEWHKNLTPEQKELFYRQTHLWYYNLSEEEKLNYSDSKRKYFNSLTDAQKREFIHKSVTRSKDGNELINKFNNYFNNSHLVNDYYLEYEVVMTDGPVLHPWDIGIRSKDTNKLEMLVDIDGDFYHADKCDYDGIHSKEEYDEKRIKSIENIDIKWYIINDAKFSKCFEDMMKNLMLDYDEYINKLFKMFRPSPFPYPMYTHEELGKSFKDLIKMKCYGKYHDNLSINTRVGDRIIYHFHRSIYFAHTRNNVSPHDAWYDDKLFRKCIENRVIYQPYINRNKILQGFNISKIAPKVSVFSAGRAKMIIYKYLISCNEIFDPFSGFSGRMLGAVSLCKHYIGQDISPLHVRESNSIINTFYFNRLATITCADINDSYGDYECLFTCPPYGSKETWFPDIRSNKKCDDWIDICLEHFNCDRYVFVVDYTEKYAKYIRDIIINKTHFNQSNEYIIVIDK